MVSFDSNDPGTSEAEWSADDRFAALPRLSLEGAPEVVVIAAHPDDETLGAGGLMATAVLLGITVSVIVVTNGAPGGDAEVALTRASEVRDALGRLGVRGDPTLLAFSDGGIRESRVAITQALREELSARRQDTLFVAPWRGDGHRDHRVLGEIVAEIATDSGHELWEYPIWMWHWADPDHPDVPWGRLGAVPLGIATRRTKTAALGAFISQTTSRGALPPMLQPAFLRHFDRSHEYFALPSRARADSTHDDS